MARMQIQHPAIVSVGRQIRARREDAGLSQEEFAARAGLDRAYYSHIERGQYNITLSVLFRIAWVLKCDPSDLLPPLSALEGLPARSKAARTSTAAG